MGHAIGICIFLYYWRGLLVRLDKDPLLILR